MRSTELFVTHCRGLGNISQQELLSHPGVSITKVAQGKVFFRVEQSVTTNELSGLLRGLSSVERVFIAVDVTPNSGDAKLPQAFTAERISEGQRALAQRLAAIRWHEHLETWRSLHSDVECTLVKEWRVACKLRGVRAKGYNAHQVAGEISTSLAPVFESLGYVHGPAYNVLGVEVYIHINEKETVVALPLYRTQGCLSQRLYRAGQPQGGCLHSCVAWAMARLAGLDRAYEGLRVCDLMAGQGITLIEAARMSPVVQCIGGDCCDQQLQQFQVHLAKCPSSVSSRIAPINWLVGQIPLPDASIDVILGDLPFGRKYGQTHSVDKLYPAVVRDMDRVCKLGAVAVLLTSRASAPVLIAALEGRVADKDPSQITSATSLTPSTSWVIEERMELSLGTLPALIIKARHVATNEHQRLREDAGAGRRARILRRNAALSGIPLATERKDSDRIVGAKRKHQLSTDGKARVSSEAIGTGMVSPLPAVPFVPRGLRIATKHAKHR